MSAKKLTEIDRAFIRQMKEGKTIDEIAAKLQVVAAKGNSDYLVELQKIFGSKDLMQLAAALEMLEADLQVKVDKTKPEFIEPEKKTYGRKKMKNEKSTRRGFLLEDSAWELILKESKRLDMTASRYIRYLVRKALKLDDTEVREE